MARSRRLPLKIFLVAALMLLLCCRDLASREGGATPRIQGTFLQLTAAHGDWPDEAWARLFGYFKQLKLSQLVIQWTVYDDLAFFPGSDCRPVARPPLETILRLADAAGMKVWVGLAHDPGFWDKIQRDPSLVEVYFRGRQNRSQALAGQLAPLVQQHPSFCGWYLTEEMDDVNWQSEERRRVLFAFLKDLTSFLHRLTPGAPVAVSGFANARTDPQAFGRFWRDLLGTTAIDAVFFQDGIGAEKLRLEDLPLYLTALRQAAEANHRTLQVVVEIFRQVSQRPFRAAPAPWERLQRQLKVAAPYSRDGILAFSVPEYLTPLGGPEATRLFEEAGANLKSGSN